MAELRATVAGRGMPFAPRQYEKFAELLDALLHQHALAAPASLGGDDAEALALLDDLTGDEGLLSDRSRVILRRLASQLRTGEPK